MEDHLDQANSEPTSTGIHIEAVDLSFRYRRQPNNALSAVNLRIDEGDFITISGPNGAGKTTLILCLCGVIPKIVEGTIGGEVLINEESLRSKELVEIGQHIGVVLQDTDAQLFMPTVQANLAQALELRGIEHTEINRRILEVAKLLRIENILDKKVDQLSGGQRQRVVVASIVALRPRLILLDEPTAELDPQGVDEVFSILGELNREAGVTIVVTTHEIERACQFANQLIILEEGKVLTEGAPQSVLLNTKLADKIRFPEVTELYMKFPESIRQNYVLPITTHQGVNFCSKLVSDNLS